MTGLDIANLINKWAEAEIEAMLSSLFIGIVSKDAEAPAHFSQGLRDLAAAKIVAVEALTAFARAPGKVA